MTPFQCGCLVDASDIDRGDYCFAHEPLSCHANGKYAAHLIEKGECPPCKLARLRSVNLDSSATPTRGQR